ncbi:MAG: stage II sporulation protein M [Nitriliruptorales bacterium]|nr:stage II sporulation protein M [Nitriliruptorales bacterium]
MDIDRFVAEHRPVWDRLEEAVADGPRGLARRGGDDIAELVRDYLAVSGHLAEARTRYGDPELDRYLSRLVSMAQGAIYGARPTTTRGLLDVFAGRYRAAIRRTLPHIVVAAAVLAVAIAGSALWAAFSGEAQAGVVPGFVDNLAGDADRELREASGSLSGFIFLNNVRVALLAFALGITLTAGTLLVLVQNGLLIGGLAGTATAFGGGARFWQLVLPHGFLELTAIVIAAGAGIRIGWSIVDPGDRLRRTALAEETKDAVLVAVGVIPAFLLAAAIEGLVTGVTGLPWVEIGLGALVAVGYVAWLAGLTARNRRTSGAGAAGAQSAPRSLIRR